jgi:CheY-like chemotaxis protein
MDKRRVLIVDDETSFLDIMNVILPPAGFDIITSTHGAEALKLFYECQPDLALLDDMLPGMSGGDICLTIKSDPLVRHIPVVLYSAGPRVRDGEFVRNIRANAVLYKPFKPIVLVRTINDCLIAAAV